MSRSLANVNFTLGRREADRIILRDTKRDKNIIYGGKALNAQVIPQIRVPTLDYDIYTRKSPRAEARQMERKLDRKFRADLFETRRAIHPQTHRVVNKVTKRAVVDYTRMPKPQPEYVKVEGVRYIPLRRVEARRRRILRDRKSAFRHHKDREAVEVIEIDRRLKATPVFGR